MTGHKAKQINAFSSAAKRPVAHNGARFVALCAMAVSLSACFGGKAPVQSAHINNETKFSKAEYGVAASPRLTTKKAIKRGGGYVSLGKPYKIKGKWYTPKDEPNYNKTGVASWYGPNFHGRLTANGEIYDQYSLSAAHPTLPLPSYVRVTNLANNNSTIVRVNDRGPYAHGRLIDLSSKTADVLNMKREGTAKVRVEYLGRAPLHGQDVAYLENSINAPGYKPSRTTSPIVQQPSVMVAAAPTNPSTSTTAQELFTGVPTPAGGIQNGSSLADIGASGPVGPTGSIAANSASSTTSPSNNNGSIFGGLFKGKAQAANTQGTSSQTGNKLALPADKPGAIAANAPMQLPGISSGASSSSNSSLGENVSNGSLVNSFASRIDDAHSADSLAEGAIKELLDLK